MEQKQREIYGTPGYSEITIDLTNLYKMMELKMYV